MGEIIIHSFNQIALGINHVLSSRWYHEEQNKNKVLASLWGKREIEAFLQSVFLYSFTPSPPICRYFKKPFHGNSRD